MRVLIPTLILGCLALLVWLVYGEILGGEISPAPDHASGRAADEQQPPESPEPAPKSIEVEGAASDRQPVVSDEGPTGEVVVVTFASGEPLAGAVVHYSPPEFDWNALEPERRQELSALSGFDTEAFLREIGGSVVTDDAGRCRVPAGEHGTQVVARAGELFGMGYLQAEASDALTLRLRTDRTLRVLLLDGADQPVEGVNIRCARLEGGQRNGIWDMGKTDAAGRVERPHIQGFAGEAGSGRAAVYPHPPGGGGPGVEIDLAAPPPEVVLRLPATGKVTIRVETASGEPIDPWYLFDPVARLAAFDARPEDPRRESRAFSDNESWQETVGEDGTATFERVQLDRYLVAKFGHHLDAKGFDGPSVAELQVEVTLRETADGAVFVGRALGPDRRPLADSVLSISCRYERGSRGNLIRTDAGGRFRSYLGQFPEGRRATVDLRTRPQLGARPGAGEDVLVVELPEVELQRVNDLGEVVLLPQPLILAGKLVHEDGTPDAGVDLGVERRRGRRWARDHEMRVVWSEGGRFEVRGSTAPEEPLRLVVRAGRSLPVEPIECKAGATDLEIRLRAAASATAVFLVDESIPHAELIYRFRRIEPPGEPDSYNRRMEKFRLALPQQVKDGRLERTWNGLTPGTYRLTVKCPGVADPVALVDGIAVRAGPCDDARLQAIDLRGRVRRLRVRATAADGRAVADPLAFVVVKDSGDEEWYGFHLGGGSADLVATGPVDLMVLAPGHRMAEPAGVRDDLTVQLQPAAELVLRVELPGPLPEGVGAFLVLQPQLGFDRRTHVTLDNGRGMNLSSFLEQVSQVGIDGTAVVAVRHSAEYEVMASVGRGRPSVYIHSLDPLRMKLSATESGSRTVRILPKGFADAIGGLRR